jgi:cytoskeletal protein CcmA (bactofilin family)
MQRVGEAQFPDHQAADPLIDGKLVFEPVEPVFQFSGAGHTVIIPLRCATLPGGHGDCIPAGPATTIESKPAAPSAVKDRIRSQESETFMWYRSKKDEEAPAKQAGGAPEPEPKEAIPMATHSTRTADFGTVRSGALIGKSLSITGEIRGEEDLVIDGKLEGDVDLPQHRLTIGPSGVLHGKIRAREIVVYGTVQGNLHASERVEIKKHAKVIGDLKAQRPVIEDEAYFKGNVETVRAEAPKPAAASPQPAAPSQAAPAPAPAPAAPQAAASAAAAGSAAPRQENRKG